MRPDLTITDDGQIDYKEVPRETCKSPIEYVDEMARGVDYMNAPAENEPMSVDAAAPNHLIEVSKTLPYTHLKSPSYGIDPTIRVYDKAVTCDYLRSLRDIASNGVSFKGQVALLTGAGRGSIAIEVGKALLQVRLYEVLRRRF